MRNPRFPRILGVSITAVCIAVIPVPVSANDGPPAAPGDPRPSWPVYASEPAEPKASPAVRDLAPSTPKGKPERLDRPLVDVGLVDQTGTHTTKLDPLAGRGVHADSTPLPLLTFDGLDDEGFTPPDPNGAVGPSHYVQMVNVSFTVYDKTGANLIGRIPFNALYSGSGLSDCENNNHGYPIVLYDRAADRWLLSQPVYTGNSMCIAISQTPDPMAAYWLYQFDLPDVPDYPKLGVWSDGYYLGTNTGFANSYYAYVLDRTSMLVGSPATFQFSNGHPNFLMPADVDGPTLPPPGSPGVFYTFLSDGYPNHPPGVDRLQIYEFDVDWVTPGNSTFTLTQEIPIAAFNYTVCGFFAGGCIPQPGTSQLLDTLSYWPMWRLAYRNFGTHEAMVSNFTVDLNGTDKAAIRWFELRKVAQDWTLYQEGTYAPDSDHRWMGSIAMDIAGNIALGYSVSSATTLHEIRYTIRQPGDPLGTLQAEATMYSSNGVHTGTHRWGDYTSMTVDPADDCTFWYTNQYDLLTNAGFSWETRIGTFKVPGCSAGTPIFYDGFESGDTTAWTSTNP
jgi:hypothetical protein